MLKIKFIPPVVGGVVTIIVIIFFGNNLLFPVKYDIYLDPFKDPQDLFVTARVTLQNTGNSQLTNVIIDYGGYIDKIPILKPGQKLLLSPPIGNKLEMVTVTTDEGIHMTKSYRLPTKMPGMMGS